MTKRPSQRVPRRCSGRDGLIVLSVGAFAAAVSPGSAGGTSPALTATPITDVAFHDGADLPIQALAFFPVVVLDADHAPADAVRALARAGSRPLARMAAQPRKPIDDLTARARRLATAGYEGALLEIGAGSNAAAGWTARGVAGAIAALRAVWPRGPLLLAADPRLAVEAAPELSGLVVVGAVARAPELLAIARRDLSAGRTAPLPVIDIESVPAGRRIEARRLAERVAHAGLIPWVTIGGRDRLGLGAIEPIARRVLVVQDSAEEPRLASSTAHRLLAVPLEHLGYVVDYADVRTTLPSGDLAARYAGIVTWFTDDDLPGADRLETWLSRQLDDGLKIAIIDHLGFAPSPALLRRLGLVAPRSAAQTPLRVSSSDDWIGFEAPATPHAREKPTWDAPALHRHLEISDAQGQRFVAVGDGDWGGIALAPYVIAEGAQGRHRWIIDPFRFLAGALALPPIPVPDPTTANGRRVLEIHIDGDGFVSVAELPDRPFAGEVIRRDVLARYGLPTTVSIIEGEIGPSGLYPDKSPALEGIARRIFGRPEVEIASHSYSHPFDWLRAERSAPPPDDSSEEDQRDGDRLPIPGYVYSLEREIDGSIAYINSRLAPTGKSTRMFLWSGDALPPDAAIERTDALAIENMNGDNAEEPGPRPTLSQVPSFVRPVGGRTQIYAPAQNENLYTNLWRGPFYGFRRVIDYFRYTDAPRRLKPIGIYYHFYSGTKAAAIKALHDVYAWAHDQETFPVWASEYAASVRGFEDASLARGLDGRWLFRGLGSLGTVRLPAALGWPDLDRSEGVIGVRDLPQGRYVALAPAKAPALVLSPNPPRGPYLVAANAAVTSFERSAAGLSLRLRGHVPVEVEIGGCPDAISAHGVPLSMSPLKKASNVGMPGAIKVTGRSLRFDGRETGEINVACASGRD
jgi:hypothetical protein